MYGMSSPADLEAAASYITAIHTAQSLFLHVILYIYRASYARLQRVFILLAPFRCSYLSVATAVGCLLMMNLLNNQ